MRRWFFVFLLVLLPLQLTWAAASAYCQHEDNFVSSHVGHHLHQHSETKIDTSETVNIGSVDADCGTCHAGCAFVLPFISSAPGLYASCASIADHQRLRASPHADLPDRPQWPTLA